MSNPKIGFVSLGCPKALVDSERILTQLRTEHYDLVSDYQNADLVVVNTCGFIDSAKQESLNAIGEAIAENGKVIVTGCMGVEETTIRAMHPQVLSVSGPQQYAQVVNAVHQYAPIQQQHDPYTDLVPPQGIKLTPKHYAYLKISEGCNHRCSFCIIPSMRGDLVSRPIDEVMREAEGLVKAGVKELLVISQDTSAYGLDLKYQARTWHNKEYETRMLGLCDALGELGIWTRLHYVYPYPHVDKIIPLMADGKILPYLDIPFQHAGPRILKAMKRPGNAENTLDQIRRWRDTCPDLSIRSTFIVGFPGETEEDFQLLLDWLDEAQLDRVGCFEYSPVAGAKANELADPVPDDIKKDRWDRFMQTQQHISTNKLQQKIGRSVDVLIDEVTEEGAVGRSYADAPEIDGLVFLDNATYLKPGDMVNATITDADEYDLWAEPNNAQPLRIL
ncbi:MAG: 30S ribosomal protein S12 methylthiotransferase RimO [Pseudomonadales bacterium]|nr:30S ribosomal protein S12 methylthiotransferase RimO [Pseudomonadales bacterium]MCP5213934.1 30S ribosomal protein S12 methylthiotransferase RimO [Pseudomonadales bacterium]MCP5302856.1 30S ribosomal protein S12 methylthiotransferase RimO [Pseudomonadales bacterium]